MNQIRILTTLCAGILLWIVACTTDHNKSDLLSEVLHAVDNNPQEALKLLESISPELYDSDKDQYMQFVVTMTQARYMDYQDITGDSLILGAQRYFAQSRNYEMAARASYYAAIYWYEGETNDKAVEYWQAAFHFAEQAGNNLFMAKSAYWLGRSYFIQEQWEDALLYCQKAFVLYDNQPDPGHYKLYITEMLGQIYRRLQDPEQAYRYFDNGLKMAKNLNDTKYESRFLKNIGTIHRDKGEYQQAKEYFDQALSKKPEPEDRMRIYLSYAKLYRAMNLPDSTIHCLNIIKEHISEINYPNTFRDIYSELTTYYQSNGVSVSEIAHSLLTDMEDLRIKKSQSEKKVYAINQEFEQLKQKKQIEERNYRRIFDYGLITLLILASLLTIVWFNKRGLKEKYKQIRQLLFSQTIDQQHFLLGGLRSVAKSTDDLYQKKLAYTGSPVWEQQLVLLEEFSAQLAGYAKTKLEKLHNGKIALLELTPEDLSIIHLSQMKLADENIGWMLGHKGNTKEYIMLRKGQIRQILTKAGMTEKDIKNLLPERK